MHARTHLAFATLGLAALGLGTVPSARAQTIYGLSLAGTTTSLVRFEAGAPGAVTTVGALDVVLEGLDFRPSNGLLYGYSQTGSIYTIDPITAALSLVASTSPGTSTDLLGIDFNPVPDLLRVVNINDQNYRINIETNTVNVDGTLRYAAGDSGFGLNPTVIDVAYTNADTDPTTGTMLYGIDAARDVLVLQNPPNDGTLTTIGSLGVNTDSFTGFDIFTSGGINTAYAVLTPPGATSISSLYTINLATGAATRIGGVGAPLVYGIAVAPAQGEVIPEPGTLALLAGTATLGLPLVRRRRRG